MGLEGRLLHRRAGTKASAMTRTRKQGRHPRWLVLFLDAPGFEGHAFERRDRLGERPSRTPGELRCM